VSGQLHTGRFTPRERAHGTHWLGGWVGPRAVLDPVAKRNIPNLCRDSNPHRPACGLDSISITAVTGFLQNLQVQWSYRRYGKGRGWIPGSTPHPTAHHVQNDRSPLTLLSLYSRCRGGWTLKFTAHLHRVPRLRICGSSRPCLCSERCRTQTYEGVSKRFRTGRLERELQMVQISATRCSCIAIL
jgi:hypothetical protein